jgi:micrococcal nuclease
VLLTRLDHSGILRRLGLSLAAATCCAFAGTAVGQTPSAEAKVSAWATGGTSATAKPGEIGSTPASGGAMPYWQAPAVPQAVVQGGAIPPGWQPQAIPYHGIGPDGKPITMMLAPTYVFTYQAGPPVPAVPGATSGVTRQAPAAAPAAGWNYATSGAPPVNPALPAATVARYPPTPYQFPADARALTGTPIVPPAGSPSPVSPPPAMAAPVAAPPAPAPTQWVSSTPPPSAAPPSAPLPPSSGDWVTVVPPAVASAALAAGATTAGSQAANPALASVPAPAAPASAAVGGTPAQPVSTGLAAPPSSVAAPHLWRVVGVQDGDTLTCLDESNQQQKIRLSDIDAPEIGQDYGKASREALAALVFGKTVEVVDQGRDESGRWIARVMVDGIDVNRQMVATGSAWHYAAYSNDQSLAAIQAQAQSQKQGLWAAPAPTPPWVYRQSANNT